MTREEAEKILRQFICIDRTPAELDYSTIREALRRVVELSDYQIFGICADNAEQATAALQTYLNALEYDEVSDFRGLRDGVVYVKYNPRNGYALMSPYDGEHRGVLVSCQSAYDDRVNETFGHLPLDLFS